ncbi:hypothetical protein EYC59_01125 [Candidatus Saccharibacteria bacterium]|nr:MAG: hypothetical protein EYC59_01125 [Candidatus Saccharibacteria bacterium]
MSIKAEAGVSVTKNITVDGLEQQAILLATGEAGRTQGVALDCAQVAQGIGQMACQQINCNFRTGVKTLGGIESTTFVLTCEPCTAPNPQAFGAADKSLRGQVERLTREQRPEEI